MAHLTIDIAAIIHNYKLIQDKIGSDCEAAAVVKADCYGCGMAAIAPALCKAGARSFFVATLDEALELRELLGTKPVIASLGGFDEKDANDYAAQHITPILNTAYQVKAYAKTSHDLAAPILHIDTGMNRLGVHVDQVENLVDINPSIVMSHFACADEDVEMNELQYEAFIKAASRYPEAGKSLSNSFGIFRNDKYHFNVVRPGMALYGLNPRPDHQNPMKPAVNLKVPVLQVETVGKGQTIGYGATHRFENKATVATIGVGYADGVFRSLGNKGQLFWKGYACPIRGRISMDLTCVDLSEIPEADHPKSGDMMELIGPNQSADDLAVDAGTIGYEILTALGQRYKRQYIGAD